MGGLKANLVRKIVPCGQAEMSVSLGHAGGAHLRVQQDCTVILKKEYMEYMET